MIQSMELTAPNRFIAANPFNKADQPRPRVGFPQFLIGW